MTVQTHNETIQIDAKQLLEQVKLLIHEGNVRRITIRRHDAVLAEFPLTIGVIGTLLAPIGAACGTLLALLNDCRIEVERVEPAPQASTKPIYKAQLVEAPTPPSDPTSLTGLEQWLQEQAIEYTD
jgi:hypothetical protein